MGRSFTTAGVLLKKTQPFEGLQKKKIEYTWFLFFFTLVFVYQA